MRVEERRTKSGGTRVPVGGLGVLVAIVCAGCAMIIEDELSSLPDWGGPVDAATIDADPVQHDAARGCDGGEVPCGVPVDRGLTPDLEWDPADVRMGGDTSTPGDCAPGAVDEEACPNASGTLRTRACVDGGWGPWSACASEQDGSVANCAEGETRSEACGRNLRGERVWRCEGGAWVEPPECDDPDECVDGADEERVCGHNGGGLEVRTCIDGAWPDWPAADGCEDPDECRDEAVDARPCDDGGEQARACVGGRWSPWSACAVCEEGDIEEGRCGLNDRGGRVRECVDGRFEPWRCTDPDECRDGGVDSRACGLNGRGIEQRACVEGAWSNWSACGDHDVCVDGLVEERPCGFEGRGRQLRRCVGGVMGAWGECEGGAQCDEGFVLEHAVYRWAPANAARCARFEVPNQAIEGTLSFDRIDFDRADPNQRVLVELDWSMFRREGEQCHLPTSDEAVCPLYLAFANLWLFAGSDFPVDLAAAARDMLLNTSEMPIFSAQEGRIEPIPYGGSRSFDCVTDEPGRNYFDISELVTTSGDTVREAIRENDSPPGAPDTTFVALLGAANVPITIRSVTVYIAERTPCLPSND